MVRFAHRLMFNCHPPAAAKALVGRFLVAPVLQGVHLFNVVRREPPRACLGAVSFCLLESYATSSQMKFRRAAALTVVSVGV